MSTQRLSVVTDELSTLVREAEERRAERFLEFNSHLDETDFLRRLESDLGVHVRTERLVMIRSTTLGVSILGPEVRSAIADNALDAAVFDIRRMLYSIATRLAIASKLRLIDAALRGLTPAELVPVIERWAEDNPLDTEQVVEWVALRLMDAVKRRRNGVPR